MEDGKTKSQVAAEYGIPKNTFSGWLKNKDKIFEATKKQLKTPAIEAGYFCKLG